ncbi:MAG: asparaginase [Spirochaetes bacterium]|nr:asparaginase [Spirochaetota bacterium]
MSVKLVEVTRDPIVECYHYGDIAVVNSEGQLLSYAGDANLLTYSRSSVKPIQAINVFLSGAQATFQFTNSQLAIMCASHYGETFHIKAIREILNKIGLTVNHLQCGVQTSINGEYALQLAKNQTELTPAYNDCSGKQSGMLAACVAKKYDITDYLNPSHPVQKEIKKIISNICQVEEDKLIIGVDGCTAPVFALPLYNSALGIARFADSDKLGPEYATACSHLFKAINAHPEMLAGTNGFCTELIRLTNGKLIGKLGAEGVYLIGIKNHGIGIAIKIADGGLRGISSAAVSVLEQLELLSKSELENLAMWKVKDNLNTNKMIVGKIKPVFTLKKV